jgi:FtsH-binding integral membrane protein
VLGALALYVDIINIFAMLLTLFSADNWLISELNLNI